MGRCHELDRIGLGGDDEMRIGISRLHFPVTTLGPGRRIGLWLQGCSIHCPGCVSRDTWPMAEDSQRVNVGEVLQWCARFASEADGVTITGGEPLDQVAPLEEFLQGFSRSQIFEHLDVLLYSGYSFGEAKLRSPLVFDLIDASITEPYVAAQTTDLVWRGSENQVLTMLTDRGRQFFGPFVDERTKVSEMQLSVASGTVWAVGIPREKLMPRFKHAMNDRGVALEGCSWQR